MTPASAVVSPLTPASRTIDPDWRPDEWDPANWLFIGDLANPRTTAWKCTTAACDAVMKAREQRCQICELAFQHSDLDSEEFAATYIPARQVAFPGIAAGRCIVGDDHAPCAFAALSQGLCESHYGLWIRYRRLHPGAGVGLEQWATTIARPRAASLEGCLVGRCGEALQNGRGLCCYHYRRWKQDPDADADPRSGLADRARSCAPTSSRCCGCTRRCGGSSSTRCSSATRTAGRSTRRRCARPSARLPTFPAWSVSTRPRRWPC